MAEHWYTIDGEPRYEADKREARKHGYFPSITTVIKTIENFGLKKWLKEQQYLAAETIRRLEGEENKGWFARCDIEAGKIGEEAMRKGNVFHDTIEAHLAVMKKNGSIDVEYDWPDEISPWKEHFFNYCHRYIKGIIEAEKSIASLSLGLAGKTDLIYNDMDVGFALTDWKSQNVKARPSFWDSWVWQLAGYRYMIGEIPGVEEPPAIISVVIDSNKPGPFARKVWTPEQTEWGEKVIFAIADVWRLVEKFDPREYHNGKA